ncbi:MAG: hypothetical protein O3C68_09125 [Proteobacteria bacterium]|jgi:hypothetical protein|nr:hypothetical protein [Pseudomonadota bacterium]
MGLIVFGVGFGLMIGIGLFALVIYPALKERKQEKSDHRDEQ